MAKTTDTAGKKPNKGKAAAGKVTLPKGKKGSSKNSTLSKEEFKARLNKALEKHLPSKKMSIEETTVFIRNIARQIGNNYEERTAEIVERVTNMLAGKYREDKMLDLIEKLPVEGHGY